MEESADTKEASHPVVHRTAVAGHHGVRDGLFQVDGAANQLQHRYQIPGISHYGAVVDFGLHIRVSGHGHVARGCGSNATSTWFYNNSTRRVNGRGGRWPNKSNKSKREHFKPDNELFSL